MNRRKSHSGVHHLPHSYCYPKDIESSHVAQDRRCMHSNLWVVEKMFVLMVEPSHASSSATR